MKNPICSIVLFIVFSQCVFSQEHIEKKEFVLDAAYKYAPLNPSFYDLLDTLSNSLQNCIFNALGRDYFFDIDIYEDNKIRGQIYPYFSYPHCTFNPIEVYRNTLKANKGFFHYNEKLVLVKFRGEHWSQFKVEQFFSRSYCLEAIMFSVPAETLPEVGMGLDVVTMRGFYDPIKGNLTISEHFECKGSKYYGYTVQESDTWEKVAGKFRTTIEKLQTLNGKHNPDLQLVPGSYIEVYYEIVDGVLEAIRTR